MINHIDNIGIFHLLPKHPHLGYVHCSTVLCRRRVVAAAAVTICLFYMKRERYFLGKCEEGQIR